MDTLISPRDRTKIAVPMSPETIFVAPLDLVEATVADAHASHLVTHINGETQIDTPPSISQDRHLRLSMNDISEPREGLVVPSETHVAELIQFPSIRQAIAICIRRGRVQASARGLRQAQVEGGHFIAIGTRTPPSQI